MKGSRCTFYVPVAYNDGRTIEPEIIIDIKRVLDTRFGGYTLKGPWEGCWEGQVELMMEYTVVVPPNRVKELRDTVKVILKELGQRAMYFEEHKAGAEIVSLVEKSDESEVREVPEPPAPKTKKGKRTNRKSK
jgi:hypothetical protein